MYAITLTFILEGLMILGSTKPNQNFEFPYTSTSIIPSPFLPPQLCLFRFTVHLHLPMGGRGRIEAYTKSACGVQIRNIGGGGGAKKRLFILFPFSPLFPFWKSERGLLPLSPPEYAPRGRAYVGKGNVLHLCFIYEWKHILRKIYMHISSLTDMKI